MSKNKKKPVTSGRLSPESYVKTQARTLSIIECLVSAEWNGTGMCTVIVIRGHVTGNITAGIYMVDLYCLGLKDTAYRFNIPPEDLSHFIKHGNMEVCDYALAHNIIYGAIEFAGDYGFNPHRDFSVTHFILEEDDEAVELMDIEFGLDGIPCYMRGPYDSEARVKQIEAILKANAGTGNYNIIDIDGDFGIDDNDIWEDDEDPLITLFNKISEKYNELIVPDNAEGLLEDLQIGVNYEITGQPMESEYVKFDSDEELDTYMAFFEKVEQRDQLNRTIDELNKAIVTYPGKAIFYNLLQSAYLLNNQKQKSSEILFKMMRLFPGYLYSKIAYANLMIDEGKVDEVIGIFNGARDLHQLYPGRNLFHESEAAAFWSTMCRYFVIAGDVNMADVYMRAILKHKLNTLRNQSQVLAAITSLCKLKIDRLKEAGFGDFG